MAIDFSLCGIIKSSSGKSAVASAAYQAGTKLHSDRLDKDFSYKHKEEVIYSEIALPENAPPEYKDRETFWNAVEAANKQPNAQYARQIMIALPKELSDEQNIALAKYYIKKNFTDQGIAVDWSFHKKDGNPHIHIMMPLRGFTKSGKWAALQKSEYALDENGQKIPQYEKDKNGNLILDADGNPIQKTRTRPGKGTEKLWERKTIPMNDWSSRQRFYTWRKEWVHAVNHHLELNGHSQRLKEYVEPSKKKRDPDIMIMKHEGYTARKMEQDGIVSDICEYNRQAKKHNAYINEQKILMEFDLLLLVQMLVDLFTFGQIQIIPDYMYKSSYISDCTKKADEERRTYGQTNIQRTGRTVSDYASKPASTNRRELVVKKTTGANNKRLQLSARRLQLPSEVQQSISLLAEYLVGRGILDPGFNTRRKKLIVKEVTSTASDLITTIQKVREEHSHVDEIEKAQNIETLQTATPPKMWRPKGYQEFQSKTKKYLDNPDR